MESKALVFDSLGYRAFGFWTAFNLCPGNWRRAIYLHFVLSCHIKSDESLQEY